jgi:hypothetical protein
MQNHSGPYYFIWIIYLFICALSIDAAYISAYSIKRQTVSDKDMTNMWKEAVLAQLMYNTDNCLGEEETEEAEGETCPDKLCYNKYEKHTSCYTSDNRLRYLSRY